MLTVKEKALLNAMKKRMNAEQKAAFNQLSEDEIKGRLANAEDELLKSMGFFELAHALQAKNIFDAFASWMLLKHPKGCGCLIAIVVVVVIAFALLAKSQ